MRRILARSVFLLLMLAGIFLFPWWLSAIVALAGSIMFKPYYEVLLAGLIYDLLYAAPTDKFFGFVFVGLAAAFLFFIAGIFINRHIRSFREW